MVWQSSQVLALAMCPPGTLWQEAQEAVRPVWSTLAGAQAVTE